LLIIGVQYRTVGTTPAPFMEAIREFPTACGQVAWDAVHHIARLMKFFRVEGWPVIYPYVSQKETFEWIRPLCQAFSLTGE
jgi:maleamate amidohydrolase